MPIDVKPISDKQLQEVLSFVEGHFLDIKGKDIKPAKLTKHISAFANADGGEMYIGIAQGSPVHRWEGFKNPEEANGFIQAFEELFPLGGDYLYCFLSHTKQTGVILQVTIRKTKGIVKASDGVPYIRRGAASYPVDTKEKLAILERNKGITSFESSTIPVALASVCNSETTIGFMLEVVPSAEPEEWLKKQELIKDDHPTVAAVVLFSDLPQAILPKRTGVKVYRYKTSDSEGTRDTLVGEPLSVEGCAYDLIRDAVALTKKIIEGVQVMGTKGMETVEYPDKTLHEVITNAVLHRDYGTADDVHVRIFDNRVEVESPGKLPAHITPENILNERFARNGNIVRLIHKFPNPPNKDVGEGLNTAFRAMRDNRLKDPVILQMDNSVVVQIKHEKLASAEEIIIEFLDNNPFITNREARALTGRKSENSMKSIFWKLRKKGLIQQVEGRAGFASAWEKKKSNGQKKETTA